MHATCLSISAEEGIPSLQDKARLHLEALKRDLLKSPDKDFIC